MGEVQGLRGLCVMYSWRALAKKLEQGSGPTALSLGLSLHRHRYSSYIFPLALALSAIINERQSQAKKIILRESRRGDEVWKRLNKRYDRDWHARTEYPSESSKTFQEAGQQVCAPHNQNQIRGGLNHIPTHPSAAPGPSHTQDSLQANASHLLGGRMGRLFEVSRMLWTSMPHMSLVLS